MTDSEWRLGLKAGDDVAVDGGLDAKYGRGTWARMNPRGR